MRCFDAVLVCGLVIVAVMAAILTVGPAFTHLVAVLLAPLGAV